MELENISEITTANPGVPEGLQEQRENSYVKDARCLSSFFLQLMNFRTLSPQYCYEIKAMDDGTMARRQVSGGITPSKSWSASFEQLVMGRFSYAALDELEL